MIRPASIEPVLHVCHDVKLGFAIKLTAETRCHYCYHSGVNWFTLSMSNTSYTIDIHYDSQSFLKYFVFISYSVNYSSIMCRSLIESCLYQCRNRFIIYWFYDIQYLLHYICMNIITGCLVLIHCYSVRLAARVIVILTTLKFLAILFIVALGIYEVSAG